MQRWASSHFHPHENHTHTDSRSSTSICLQRTTNNIAHPRVQVQWHDEGHIVAFVTNCTATPTTAPEAQLIEYVSWINENFHKRFRGEALAKTHASVAAIPLGATEILRPSSRVDRFASFDRIVILENCILCLVGKLHTRGVHFVLTICQLGEHDTDDDLVLQEVLCRSVLQPGNVLLLALFHAWERKSCFKCRSELATSELFNARSYMSCLVPHVNRASKPRSVALRA